MSNANKSPFLDNEKKFVLSEHVKAFSIYQDKCLMCKLAAAPMFFALGGYFAFRNR